MHQLRSFFLNDLMYTLERYAEELGALAQRMTVGVVGYKLRLLHPPFAKVPAFSQVSTKLICGPMRRANLVYRHCALSFV